MTSSRPYLIRALYEWIVDNALTPHLLVDTQAEGLEAPVEYAENGKLVLNVSPRAVRGLSMGNEVVSFDARFAGQSRRVSVPVQAVLAIYARENGQGMLFGDRDDGGEPPSGGGSKPRLRVVK